MAQFSHRHCFTKVFQLLSTLLASDALRATDVARARLSCSLMAFFADSVEVSR